MSQPLKSALSMQLVAALLSLVGVLGLGLLHGERKDHALLADAHRIDAAVVEVRDGRARVAYEVDGVRYRNWLDDRRPGVRAIGEQVAVEVPRASPDRPVHRVAGGGDMVVSIGLTLLGLALGVGFTVAALRLRARCERSSQAAPGVLRRTAAALFELAFAAAFVAALVMPQALPSGLPTQLASALRFEAALLCLMTFGVPFLMHGPALARDLVFGIGLAIACLLLGDFIARGEGDWVWGLFLPLMLARGSLLFGRSAEIRLQDAQRWAMTLSALLGSFWIAYGLLGFLPLPGPGGITDPDVLAGLPSDADAALGCAAFRAAGGVARVRLAGPEDRPGRAAAASLNGRGGLAFAKPSPCVRHAAGSSSQPTHPRRTPAMPSTGLAQRLLTTAALLFACAAAHAQRTRRAAARGQGRGLRG
jgi:hypothetical protein